jgi:hypothetical protein
MANGQWTCRAHNFATWCNRWSYVEDGTRVAVQGHGIARSVYNDARGRIDTFSELLLN